MKTRRFVSMVLVFFIMAAISPAFARRTPKKMTDPGKYTDWGPEEDIDELEIVKTFKTSDYKTIVVEPFDTDGTRLPDKDDNTYDPVKRVLSSATEGFITGLRGSVMQKVLMEDKGKGEGVLIIRGKVDTMDPGSQAARYFVGFGAGASRTKISGEIVDGSTGEVLARFAQERRSGVGGFGGDYREMMMRNLAQIGEDVASILKQF